MNGSLSTDTHNLGAIQVDPKEKIEFGTNLNSRAGLKILTTSQRAK
jgi:hypothetical protein